MGFEFKLVAVSGSSADAWAHAGECFATQVVPYARVNVRPTMQGALQATYELAAPSSSNWLEDFVIVQEDAACYVCFHRGTAEQLATILSLLTTCCLTAGITGSFEEL